MIHRHSLKNDAGRNLQRPSSINTHASWRKTTRSSRQNSNAERLVPLVIAILVSAGTCMYVITWASNGTTLLAIKSVGLDKTSVPNTTHLDTSWLGNEWNDEECIPAEKWQVKVYSPYSGNSMHELDVVSTAKSMAFIKCGGRRCAYQVEVDTPSGPVKLVLKTAKLKSDKFDEHAREVTWVDSIAMERLTSSSFIMNIYGYCGVSQLMELADHPVYHQILHARQSGHDVLTPLQKLKIGYQMAMGVAHLHELGVAHNDLDTDQFLLVDGTYKMSDFHLASFTKQTRQGNVCLESPLSKKTYLDKTRAPEELERPKRKIRREKADVWVLGDVLYHVLTNLWDFEGITNKEARRALVEGRHSKIPPQILKSNNAADKAMMKAIEMAWVYNTSDRPDARQIANYLRGELTKLVRGGKDEVEPLWHVRVPELPADGDYSERDWNQNYKDE